MVISFNSRLNTGFFDLWFREWGAFNGGNIKTAESALILVK